jgi:ketosteroid isomerase-like protein
VESENVKLLRESIAAFNRGDLDWWLDHIAPDWEYRTAQLFPGMDRVYPGREGAIRFWEHLRAPWESITMEIDRVVDLGDRVVYLVTFHAKGKQSGIQTTQRYANIITIRDGLASRTIGYGPDWDAALQAAHGDANQADA